MFVIVIEIGSGLGLFIASSAIRSKQDMAHYGDHDRDAAARDVVEPATTGTDEVGRVSGDVGEFGDVAKFACARLRPAEGTNMSAHTLQTAYENWCRDTGCRPVTADEFAVNFPMLARAIGLKGGKRGGETVYLNVAAGSEV